MLFIQKFEEPHHQAGSLDPEATARQLRLHRRRLLQQDGRNARFQDDLHGLLSNEKTPCDNAEVAPGASTDQDS